MVTLGVAIAVALVCVRLGIWQPRRLGLRTRIFLMFGFGALFLAVFLATVAYTFTRSSVVTERDRAALQALRANIESLDIDDRCQVVATDVVAWVPAMRHVDIAFIDPPYTFDAWPALLALLEVPLVVAESEHAVAAPDGWVQQRARRYGRTWVTVLERLA